MGTETGLLDCSNSPLFELKSFKPRMGTETVFRYHPITSSNFLLKSFKPRMGTETLILHSVNINS